MQDPNWYQSQATLTLERLWHRIAPEFTSADDSEVFHIRLLNHFPQVFRLLYELYGNRYDFFYHLEEILCFSAQFYNERPASLKTLDQQRETNPQWFQAAKTIGGVCYVDLFAGTITGLRNRIPYFKELGLTYLHLMPLFKAPQGNSDGGYAVSDYRTVNLELGTMSQLKTLADDLRENGISLVLDFVFNHTSNEHEWARSALAGDKDHQEYYFMFDDRTMPDAYERHLREIFPQQDPGSFTYQPEIDKWVWTTFRRFQWDLNYQNPAVFNAMLQEMLYLANQGVEVLRLDAVAFIWKQLGTTCENLPKAHTIIQAYNALLRIAAPALIFKSEAIVHPDDVASYIGWEECPLSYNPTLMALLWESLATRSVRLLQHSMETRFAIPDGCSWVNYVRCHDDIGWTFADEDTANLWINGYDHRQFLNAFYTGRFDGSHAKGVPFNYNPINQDMRISGTTASLAGLEQAIDRNDPLLIDHSIARILLIHSVILSIGGIPLIYLGDEIATLNDYSYESVPGKQDDSRWVHRPSFDDERAAQRRDQNTVVGRIFQGLRHLIDTRRKTSALTNSGTKFIDTANDHILGYIRNDQMLVLANFSEHEQIVEWEVLANHSNGVLPSMRDLGSEQKIALNPRIVLLPYQFMWLVSK